MSDAYHVRRATTDDVLALLVLWETNRLPALELEKHFTDFQVVEDGKGRLLAAIGLQVSGHEANLHSESFLDYAMADSIRPLLWERLQHVANKYGLARIWTRETAPYWRQSGFSRPSEALLHKLPTEFGEPDSQHWLSVQLKEDKAMPVTLEKEFEVFIQEERGRTQEVLQQARAAKWIVTLILAVLFVLVLAGLVFALKQGQTIR
jgi:N-acetylglutamate synthase-like GNAT family acetyltransferase